MIREAELRLHLAGKWEPQDYLAAISAVEVIYYVTLVHSDFFEGSSRSRFGYRSVRSRGPLADLTDEVVGVGRDLADTSTRLIVQRINHASPGFMDFSGFGEIANAMERAFSKLIDVATGRRLRRELDERAGVETEILRENLNSLKIENARKLLELSRDYSGRGSESDLLRILVGEQGKLENLAVRGLITDHREHRE